MWQDLLAGLLHCCKERPLLMTTAVDLITLGNTSAFPRVLQSEWERNRWQKHQNIWGKHAQNHETLKGSKKLNIVLWRFFISWFIWFLEVCLSVLAEMAVCLSKHVFYHWPTWPYPVEGWFPNKTLFLDLVVLKTRFCF